MRKFKCIGSIASLIPAINLKCLVRMGLIFELEIGKVNLELIRKNSHNCLIYFSVRLPRQPLDCKVSLGNFDRSCPTSWADVLLIGK